jgi:hypothetical protein
VWICRSPRGSRAPPIRQSSPGTWCKNSVLTSSVRALVAQTAMSSVTSSSSVLGGRVFSDRVS